MRGCRWGAPTCELPPPGGMVGGMLGCGDAASGSPSRLPLLKSHKVWHCVKPRQAMGLEVLRRSTSSGGSARRVSITSKRAHNTHRALVASQCPWAAGLLAAGS